MSKSSGRYFLGPRAQALMTRPPAPRGVVDIVCDVCHAVWEQPVIPGDNLVMFRCTCGAKIHGNIVINSGKVTKSEIRIEENENAI